MIEFKQIIGRGTRLYDGKDYFTIYDFVKAHHHFNDPEWDGEPIEPEPAKRATLPVRKPPATLPVCGSPCECRKSLRSAASALRLQEECEGQARRRQGAHHPAHDVHDLLASRRHADVRAAVHGIAVRQAAGVLQGRSRTPRPLERPDTRKKLLQGLAEKGFGHDQLAEMQKIIDAEKSDLFDVLAHVAYAMPPLTREERAAQAKVAISTPFQQQAAGFLDFVLAHYVSVGVDELDQEKLTPLLRLKYPHSIADAVADLGTPEEISRVFVGFQKYLYQEGAA